MDRQRELASCSTDKKEEQFSSSRSFESAVGSLSHGVHIRAGGRVGTDVGGVPGRVLTER